jgi:lactoylglutathione lyase
MPATVRFEIFPADLNVTATFYTEVLGFTVAQDRRRDPDPYIYLARDRIGLGAALARSVASYEQRRPPIGVELVLEVDDLEAERNHVSEAGWSVDEDLADRPWGLRDFRLIDPDGYYWRITNRAD